MFLFTNFSNIFSQHFRVTATVPLNYFLKESANQSCLKKDSPKVPEHIKKDLYMNSQ